MGAGYEAGTVWPGLELRSEGVVYCFDQQSCEPCVLIRRSDPEGQQFEAGRAAGDGAELIMTWGGHVQGGGDEAYNVTVALVYCNET